MDIRKFGHFIAKIREENEFTQSMLADRLNVTRQAVSKWENGDTFPDIALLPKLSEIFEKTIDDILNYGELTAAENTLVVELAKEIPDNLAENWQRCPLKT